MSTMRYVSWTNHQIVPLLLVMFFLWDPSKTAMNKCGMVTMINTYKINNFKHHFDPSKPHEKILKIIQSYKEKEKTNRGEVRKKITQYLLLCAKRPKTSSYVQ